ncbi:HDIG domain-containing protein [Rhodohalobacter sp. SW132]|uniref:HD family phosphohydrolase n=1 Tax=Rhodohalobacter sp. SW132 TaxID=2293433 RepID=UPI000E222845|nr:HDIG domain-containing metalloprotein [Rhodohalobacter sp. SW132]REL37564.1 HDIG domain-containing protein [Rhodohalobacter sp. SW132]
MKVLEKLGLGRKKSEGAPNIGEKKKKEQIEAENKRKVIYRVLIIFGFLGLILYASPDVIYQPVSSYSVGEPWRADDLTAPFTFSELKTEEELQDERDAIRSETPPVFHVNNAVRNESQDALDSMYRNLQPVIDAYVQWQRSKQSDDSAARNDSIRFVQEKNLSNVEFTDEAWNVLLENYANMRLNNGSQGRSVLNEIRTELDRVLTQIYNSGVLDIPKDDIETREITVRNLQERTERTIILNNTRDLYDAIEFAQNRIRNQFSADIARIALQITDQVLEPNWEYNEEATEAILSEQLDEISRTKGVVTSGEVIIRRGDIVTAERENKLRSLAEARASTATQFERFTRQGGEALIIIVVTILFLYYLFLYRKPIFNDISNFLMVFLILAALCVGSAIIYQFETLNMLVVPIAIAPIILTIIFDSRVGLMATITLAIITAVMHDNNFEYLVATITACSLGIFSVRDIKNRSQFFLSTPFIVFCSYMLVLGGFSLARYAGWTQFLDTTLAVAINSVFILFTYPLILIIEKLFRVTTDFTLLELSDTNRPLMKDLMTKAPGSFHHSLQVANLAEAAASAIEANALLCRVGAMYHDIGKMVKPSYFIENQQEGNDHDKLKAKMSALVIKAHVSDGEKMAKKNDLPQVVIDFIRTHHGTSLIRYFYDKAKKNSRDDSDVPEEDYRYDGPIPWTKEQGILLLADGVEAASRAMKNPTYNKLENLINRMVDDHISEGQLDACPLTFRHIQIIKETFLSILVGVYHSRVEYPEDDELKSKKVIKRHQDSSEPDIEARSEKQDPDRQNQHGEENSQVNKEEEEKQEDR